MRQPENYQTYFKSHQAQKQTFDDVIYEKNMATWIRVEMCQSIRVSMQQIISDFLMCGVKALNLFCII